MFDLTICPYAIIGNLVMFCLQKHFVNIKKKNKNQSIEFLINHFPDKSCIKNV